MKRFLTVLLAVFLLLTCSCATRTVYVSQNEDENTQIAEDTVKQTETKNDTNTDDITQEPQSDTAQTIQTDVSTEDISISDGVTDGQTYTNAALGIGCTLSDQWRFLTSEELEKKNGSLYGDILPLQTDDDVTSQSTGADGEEKPSHSYIMCAVYSDELSDLTLSIEYLGANASLIDVSQLLTASAEAMKPSFESLGYTDFQYEADTVNIGSRIFRAIRIFSRNDRISIDQLMFCFIKNEHLVSVCISDYGAGIIDQTEKCFFLTEE